MKVVYASCSMFYNMCKPGKYGTKTFILLDSSNTVLILILCGAS